MKKLLVLMAATMLVMGFAMNASAGDYYLFADFTNADGFLGGYDVDAYTVSDTETLLYVNRNGTSVDVYTATLHDTDGDGYIEPNQHPDNVGPDGIPGTSDDAVGPMENRTLVLTDTYNIPEIGTASMSEIYADSDRIYFANSSEGISEYIFADGSVNQVVSPGLPSYGISHIGRASDGTWFASNEDRTVYSWNGSSWNYEFNWSAFPGGGHGDGMEVISVEVSSGVYEDHVFVSDMYADYIGEYALVGGAWTQVETYTYPGSGASIVVEGMGAGGFGGHMWATGSGHLYEFGGGALPPENGGAPVPEPGTILLVGIGLVGIVLGRKSFIKKS